MRYILLMFSVILFGCDNTTDYFEKINQSPRIEFTRSTSEYKNYLEDSLKIGVKYNVGYKIIDDENLKLIPLESPNYALTFDNENIEIIGEKESENMIEISSIDSYGKKGNSQIKLTIFENLPPLARFIYQVNQLEDSYFLTIDASVSFDKDLKFGGGLILYEFTVNQFVKAQQAPVFKYSVNKDSYYTVKLRVKDNNQAWSNLLVNYIKI